MANILALPGPDSRYKQAGVTPAGFWAGVWHGLIAGVVLISSLFTRRVQIYETVNRGPRYDFGFLLGVAANVPFTIAIGPYRLG